MATEEQLQELRSKATELLLREEWQESVQVYTQIIKLCQDSSTNTQPKSLCLVHSNRAEARLKMRDYDEAIKDCDEALKIEATHFKSLLCKAKILLCLNRYASALNCFRLALLDPQANGRLETLNGYVEKCKRLEFQSKTGAFDLSEWVLGGFRSRCQDMAEYVGAVEIKRSELSGRGLFATKNIESGTLVLVTKAIATERYLLGSKVSGQNAQLGMWKNFIDKVVDSMQKCEKIRCLISNLSTGEGEDSLDVPEISLFRPETEINSSDNCSINSNDSLTDEKIIDMNTIFAILDVNSLVEDSVSAKVLGKKSDYYCVGLWILPSFINHSCSPNVRRVHVGDYLMVHASRDIQAGEELTFAYLDPLLPLNKRKEMSSSWGFDCGCKRCRFEEELCSTNQEILETEMGLERGFDIGGVIFRLEEIMRRHMVRGKEKGFVRGSYWDAYSEAFRTEKVMKKWGRRIPSVDVVVDSVVEAIGSDDRVLKVLKLSCANFADMEKLIKLFRGVCGKIVKKQAIKLLLDL